MLESGICCLYRKRKTAVSVLGLVGAGIGWPPRGRNQTWTRKERVVRCGHGGDYRVIALAQHKRGRVHTDRTGVPEETNITAGVSG